MSPDDDLPKLHARINAGDRSALDEIWRRYGAALRRRARNRLWMSGISLSVESLDVCQSILCQLLENMQRTDRKPIENVDAYLAKALENKVKELLLKFLSQRRDVRRVACDPVEEHGLADEDTSPSHRALLNDVREIIRRELSDEDWGAYELHQAGYTWPEIGQRLGVAGDAIRIRLDRARRRICEKYALGDWEA